MTQAAKYDLFISYADADRAWVEGYLLNALEQAGVSYFTEAEFAVGASRFMEFERAIQQSRRILLVLSPAYMASDFNQFIDLLAQSYGLETGNWPVIPLILEPVKLPPFLSVLVSLNATNSDEWEEAIKRLCADLQHPVPVLPPKPPCPYPGMLPFSETDSNRFFGREQEVEEAIERLYLYPFITVIGPSGSGKSSLVFAGIIPALRRSELFGSGEWLIRWIRPGQTPLTTLETVLGDSLADPGLVVAKALATQPNAQRLLLIVDQFEEVFTQAEQEAVPFQEVLLHLIETPNCYLILTVRADFYSDLMESLLWRKIQSYRLEIVPLDAAGLHEAIIKPAEDVGVFVEAALVERLVVEAAGEPGILPLIQDTLKQLWDKVERRFLPLRAYESLVLACKAYKNLDGSNRTGLQIAIANRADVAVVALSQEQRQIARRIFLRLIQFGEGRADTRRQQSVEQLRVLGEDAHLFDQTLLYLADEDRRLLILSGGEEDSSRKVDIAHEALIEGWPALQWWLTERREAEQTRRFLMRQVEEWVRLGKGSGGLLDEAELAEAGRWLSRPDAEELGYDETLIELIEASDRAIQREVEHERKLRQKAQRRAMIATIFALVAGTAATGFFVQWNQAIQGEVNTLTALSDAYLSENRELEALIASLKAGQMLRGISWLGVFSRQVTDVRIKTLGSLQQAVYGTHEINRLEKHGERVNSVNFSPDDKLLASASHDETVRLWHRNGTPIIELKHNERVTSVSFSPNSKFLASASADGTLKLWRVERLGEKVEVLPLKPLTGHKNNKCTQWYKCWVNDVSFSQDSQILASASRDKTIKLWNRVNGELIITLEGHEHDVNGISFSPAPASQTLASASSDGTVKLWNVKTGDLVQTLEGHNDGVTSINFSPDGQTLVSASIDKTLKLWHKAKANGEWVSRETLSGYGSVVYSVSFSPDAQTLMTAGEDKTVRLWSIPKPGTPTPSGTFSASLSPDGKTFAVAGWDRLLQLWYREETTSKRFYKALEGHKSTVNAVNFSSDGQFLASGSDDTTIRLWNPANGGYIRTLTGHQDIINSIAFSPDSKMLASASGRQDPAIRLWELGDLTDDIRPKMLRNHEDAVNTIAFSPDGRTLASGGRDPKVILWDPSDGTVQKRLEQEGSEINALSFSPDGKILASAEENNTIKLWQVKDGTLLRILEGHRAGVTSIANII